MMPPRFALLRCILLSLLPIESFAEGKQPLRSLVILVDGLALDDLRDSRYPHLSDFANRSYVGLMSTPVKGSQTPTSALLALAAGAIVESEPTDDDAFQAGEVVEGDRASVVWLRRTGADPSVRIEPGSSVHLGIAP